MTQNEKKAIKVLGYKNNKNWNTNKNVKAQYLKFNQLSPEQKNAAIYLGYQKEEEVPVISNVGNQEENSSSSSVELFSSKNH